MQIKSSKFRSFVVIEADTGTYRVWDHLMIHVWNDNAGDWELYDEVNLPHEETEMLLSEAKRIFKNA